MTYAQRVSHNLQEFIESMEGEPLDIVAEMMKAVHLVTEAQVGRGMFAGIYRLGRFANSEPVRVNGNDIFFRNDDGMWTRGRKTIVKHETFFIWLRRFGFLKGVCPLPASPK